MNAQTALAALSLAIRERLLGGGTAVLPGLGMLSRAHVPARVDVRPDGSRTLLPPGETVRLSAPEGDSAPLAALVVRHLGAPQADPAAALQHVLDHLEARLAATGEARLPGLGTFERTSGGVRFLPEPGLTGAFQRPVTGLPAVSQPPPPPAASIADLVPAAGIHGVPVESAAPATPPDVTAATETPPDPPAAPAAPDEAPLAATTEDVAPEAPSPPVEPDDAPTTIDDAADGAPDGAPSADDTDEAVADALAADKSARPEPWDDTATPDGVWTARDPLPPPALGDADPIEDAEFQIVEPESPADAETPHVIDFSEAAGEVPVDPVPAAEAHSPLVETVFPPSGAPVPDPPPLVPPAAPPPAHLDADDAPGPRRGVAGVLVSLIVLAALGALVAYWWIYLRDVEPLRPPAAVEAVAPAPTPLSAAADTLAAPDTMTAPLLLESPGGVEVPASTDEPDATRDAGASRGTTTSSASRAAAAEPPRAPATEARTLGRAPAAGQALLPPRLAGLPGTDATALASASGVDPARGGFTWVVLSTPSADDAEALAARYRTSGYRTGVVQTSGGARPMWRVVVGQFESRDHALRLRDRLPPQAPPDTWPLQLSR